MKRVIKFRAWLNDEEKIVYSNDQASTESCEVWIFYDGGLKIQVQETVWREGGGETFERIEYVDCNHVIMQYTGLTDKNGKEIYEGDVVRHNDYNGIVKYIGCSFMIEWLCVDVYSDLLGWYDYKRGKISEGKEYEIIGNIYENPELLNSLT